MLQKSFVDLYWRYFENHQQGAEFFHVKPVTIKRWLSGAIPVNPMAEKLLIIVSRGYLPDDNRWTGFRLDEERAIFITPTGQTFSHKELEIFGTAMAFYQFYKDVLPDDIPIRTNALTELPFKGGRRAKKATGQTITKEYKKKCKQSQKKAAEKRIRRAS